MSDDLVKRVCEALERSYDRMADTHEAQARAAIKVVLQEMEERWGEGFYVKILAHENGIDMEKE